MDSKYRAREGVTARRCLFVPKQQCTAHCVHMDGGGECSLLSETGSSSPREWYLSAMAELDAS